jgi:pimeloyl-ACP methyl ester carboxylesterase
MRKRSGLAGLLLSRAASTLDRAVTLAIRVGLPVGESEPDLGTGHEARVHALRAIEARYASLDLEHFFPEPRAIEPLARARGLLGNGLTRSDLTWESFPDTFLPELAESFHATLENRVALARSFTRSSPRPVAILVHGYMLGRLAVEERVWPIRELDALGFDTALYVLPFHGRRASPAHGGRPQFPGLEPLLACEGFRQAVTDLRELTHWFRARGHPKVGLMGMSLGGYTVALTATVDPDLDFLSPIVPLASLADFALEQGDLPEAPEPRALEHALRDRVYRHVSPVHRAPLIAPERVLVIGAKADRITPISHAKRLASHFRAELLAFPGGHVLQLGRGEAFRKLAGLLTRT